MIPVSQLAQNFTVNPPATEAAIRIEEQLYGQRLPEEYLQLLAVSNGLHTDGNLAILGVEGVIQRNADYEVVDYMPGYFMIGDDGAGTAILLNLEDRRIYEVGMGVMDENEARLSAGSLGELLALGTSLAERDGA
ncbi:SMI1/KNR4 family protein [Glutamicibacter sp. NPDC087344]|uniref:SMI1/KNR4 family protein n=1 Tax=Glutamicibacter sp. NPDC087344 TaxID=3363994 RepID=UPI003822B4C9